MHYDKLVPTRQTMRLVLSPLFCGTTCILDDRLKIKDSGYVTLKLLILCHFPFQMKLLFLLDVL